MGKCKLVFPKQNHITILPRVMNTENLQYYEDNKYSTVISQFDDKVLYKYKTLKANCTSVNAFSV